MSKLSSKIDVLKSSRAQRLHNYYGLRKSRVDSGSPNNEAHRCFFRAFWRHLADFGCHFGPSLIPRGGGPTIMFLGIMLKKWRKKGIRKRDPKKHQNLIEIWSQIGRVWEVKTSVSLGTCCKIKVFAESWNIEKICAKMGAKKDKIGAENAPRSDLWDFWAIWGDPKFRRFLGKKKVDRKSEKIWNLRPEGRPVDTLGLAR